jgi:hypothetical protein
MPELFHGLSGGILLCLLLVAVFGIPYWIWMGRTERRGFWSRRPQGHSTLGPDASGPEDIGGGGPIPG